MAVYTGLALVQQRVGVNGTALRLDDQDADVNEVFEDASATIDLYLAPRYDPQFFAGNRWVRRACTTVAVYYLCERRLNTVPAAAEQRYRELIDGGKGVLERAQAGLILIPGLPLRKADVPVLSVPRVKLAPWPHVVTQRGQSTGTPEGYRRADDSLEPPPTY